MEWAIGKNYDIYRPDTGKLLLPGAKIRWELHLHAVGEQIRDHAELAVYFFPKGEEPKHRTYLTLVRRDCQHRLAARYSAEHVYRDASVSRAESPGAA